ncbi:hypothetical protein AOA01_00305 [Listeria monocytogenes]|uniref:hypothetical protein n=1 Tax=Listeria monocytogenes TaxID=1639 RepID=UPI00077576D2|nr:hypothetical protein [Listeria monocytogenes]EAF5877620.1 hypothetical protein [Listeria monocytogenes]EKZ4877798.1 hypothetical protein [Listeria monocytogenes]KXS65754.1 hypothetical protein AWJ02_01485 [Listeria monocytogenes]KXW92909.1 hypothetical protein AWJ00_08240 [Listeria monocytogenes]
MPFIRNKARKYELQKAITITTPSGAKKLDNWQRVKDIYVTMYDKSEKNQLTQTSAGVRVKKYSHTGLTPCKDVTAKYDYRLVSEENGIFEVKGVNNDNLMSELYCERLD